MRVLLQTQGELMREHHCHHYVPDQKRWEVVHRERRELYLLLRVLLSGDERKETFLEDVVVICCFYNTLEGAEDHA